MKPEKRQIKSPGSPAPRGDDTEPTAEQRHMPVVLFVALSVALFWAGIYLNEHAGGFSPQVYPPYGSFAQVKNAQPGGEEDLKARQIYASTCALCHQPHGNGVPGQFPPLAGSEWVTGDPARVVAIVINGLQGPITVKGVQFEAAMTPFGHLSDQEIAAVVNLIRNEWGNKADKITPEQVAAVRQEHASRSEPWTAPELLKIGAQ